MNAEGWHVDPFGKHDARWFSDGRPTQLVRDGNVESHDPPPESRVFDEAALEPFVIHAQSNPDDIRRADDEAVRDPDVAWEKFNQTGMD